MNPDPDPMGTMSTDQRERFFGLTAAQVAGSTLAAMTGAFIASWAGAAGTVIGTAVASAVATVGAAAYTASLRRTSEAVRRTAGRVRPGDLPSTTGAVTPAPTATVRRIELPWGRLTLASAAVTVAVLGGLTGLELIGGQPVSTYAGGGERGGTTVGRVLGTTTKTQTTTPTDEGSGSTTDGRPGAPTQSPAPSPTPSSPPTDPAPTPGPDPAPSPTPSDGFSGTPAPDPLLPPASR